MTTAQTPKSQTSARTNQLARRLIGVAVASEPGVMSVWLGKSGSMRAPQSGIMPRSPV